MIAQHAIRSFKRAKQYYLTTVFTLGITLSMVFTVFSLVNLVFFAPLPFKDSDNLYVLEGGLKSAENTHTGSTNIFITRYIEKNSDLFSDFALYHEWTDYKLRDLLHKPKIVVMLGTANLFDVLGVEPELGRLFNQNEAIGKKQPSVILGYRAWQQHYGGDKDIVGKKIQLNQRRFTVIGVAPDDLVLPYYQNINDGVWIPFDMDEVYDAKKCANCFAGNLKGVVRLKQPGETKGINEQLDILAMEGAKLHTPHVLVDFTTTAEINAFRKVIEGDSANLVFMLAAGVVLLMAIALINLSSMQMARAVSKMKSVAISYAFGASNKQLLTESFKHNVVVIGLAVLLALCLSSMSFSLVQTLSDDAIARLDTLSLSINTILFAVFLALAISALYSLLELKVVNEKNLMASLQSSGKGVGKQMSAGTSHFLIGLQVTFSFVVLLATCHVVLVTLTEALRDNGVDTQNKWSLVIDYSQLKDKQERRNLHRSLLVQLKQNSWVESVDAISESKFPRARNHDQVYAENGGYLGNALRPRVSEHYLSNLGKHIEGESFIKGESELENYPLIINQRLADKISDNVSDVIGSKISFDNNTFYTVKGVVENTNYPGNETLEYAEAFIPRAYSGEREYSYFIAAKTADDLKVQIRELVTQVDSRLDVLEIESLDSLFAQVRLKHVSAAGIAIVLAGVSLLMVCVGINGIVNYMVQVRRYELGVKLAMGANNGILLKEGLLEFMQPVLIALLFAFSFCFMLLGYSKRLPEFAFTPDWLVVTNIVLGFVILSLLVSFIPIRRILYQDPIQSLRNE